jgi:hypothetical protein
MILETIAIRTVWSQIWNAVKSVPPFVWAALFIAGAWWIDRAAQYAEGHENGRTEVVNELRTAEAEAAKRSLEAIAEADEGKAERAEAEAEIVSDMIERIESAEAEGGNALDTLF